MIRLTYFIPVWIMVFVITIPFYLLGLLLIPLACVLKAYKKTSDNLDKPDDGATYHFTSKIMWPWDNSTSDGIACRNYYQSSFVKYGYLDMIVTAFVWSALRNPINNISKLLSPKYNFKTLSSIGSREGYGYKLNRPCWYLVWQGIFGGVYASFNINGKHKFIMAGYKLRPTYTKKYIPESQLNGVGMTFRLIPKEV